MLQTNMKGVSYTVPYMRRLVNHKALHSPSIYDVGILSNDKMWRNVFVLAFVNHLPNPMTMEKAIVPPALS